MTQFYALRRFPQGRAFEQVDEAEMREPNRKKEVFLALVIWAFSMAFACLLTYLMYRIGASLWHGIVSLGSRLEGLL